jgi:poly-gamma-glutamate synthesis protein (capsule biosynthesis protein)
MLARGVAREINRRGKSPWADLRLSPDLAPAWVGNFEGAVSPSPDTACTKDIRLCLRVEPQTLRWLKDSPFRALSIANNHIDDLGVAGHAATSTALRELGIEPVDDATGPVLLDVDGSRWALVALNLAGGSAAARQTALERARLQIGLARASTPLVAVVPHWGREGTAFAGPEQELWAQLFARWGATLIIGSHAHVIQPARCEPDVATYFGLGNHLFDQAATPNRSGLAITCCPQASGFRCSPSVTERPPTSVYPSLAEIDPNAAERALPCSVSMEEPDRRWLAHPARDTFLFVQSFPAAGPGTFFVLRRHVSSFDHEAALRPYVFRVEDDAGASRIVDVWRGTALARPLVAARLIDWRGSQLLCAIHRGDTYLARDPSTTKRVRILYRWTGFGFRGVEDEEALEACEEL